jgi:hypothetical protein
MSSPIFWLTIFVFVYFWLHRKCCLSIIDKEFNDLNHESEWMTYLIWSKRKCLYTSNFSVFTKNETDLSPKFHFCLYLKGNAYELPKQLLQITHFPLSHIKFNNTLRYTIIIREKHRLVRRLRLLRTTNTKQ